MGKAKNKASAEVTEQSAPEQAAAEQAIPEQAAAEQAAAEKTAEQVIAEQSKENPLVAVGKQQLADHPDKMEVFVSADGFGFFEKCDAENYARSLKDATIITVKR